MASYQGLQGRTAVVTGASSGMGEATARRLAEEGVELLLTAAPDQERPLQRLARELAGTHGVRTTSLVGDVGDEATARATASLARETFGTVDLLVNNAGIYPERPLLEETPEFYDRIMRTNVRGVYLMTVAVLELMPQGSAIVCTASTCSFRAIERHAAYNVSKGAVAQLARSLAVYLAPRGIRVNAVSPGVISAASTNMWVADPATWAKQRSRIPADRVGTPEEIANITTFLLSDDASFVTGAAVLADGGESAGWRDSDWVVVAADNPTARRRMFPGRVS